MFYIKPWHGQNNLERIGKNLKINLQGGWLETKEI
jgi:hypothetical protein